MAWGLIKGESEENKLSREVTLSENNKIHNLIQLITLSNN